MQKLQDCVEGIRERGGLMLYNDYLEVNNRVIYVKEEMQRRFGAEIQPAAENNAPEHHGWFKIEFRYLPKNYRIYFEGEFSYFIVRIEKGDGAFTTLNRLTDFDNTLRMSAVRESVKKLKEILEREILFIYKA